MSAAGEILLIRHGQTSYNKQGRFLGKVNAPLSELGEEQSLRAVEALCAWQPDRVVTSPLERCCDKIAMPAAGRCTAELIVDDRIAEFDFGPLEGMTYRQAEDEGWPMPWGPKSRMWPPAQGGERLVSMMFRVRCAAREIAAYEGRTAVACHGGIIRAFFGVWLGFEPEGWNHIIVDNVSSFVFASDGHDVRLVKAGLTPREVMAL